MTRRGQTRGRSSSASTGGPIRRILMFPLQALRLTALGLVAVLWSIVRLPWLLGLHLRSAIRRIGLWLWGSVVLAGHLALEWMRSRALRSVFAAAPAALGLLTIAGFFLFGRPTRASLAERYQAAAAKALANEDYEAADVLYRKQSLIDPHSETATYGQALVAEHLGSVSSTRRLMHSLAPSDQLGHPDAHWWVAREMLKTGPIDAERGALLEHHLDAATRMKGDRGDVYSMLADLALARSDLKQAVLHLEKAVPSRPGLQFRLIQLCLVQGQAQRAQQLTADAARHWQAEMQQRPDDLEPRLQLVRALVLQEQFERAVSLLEAALGPERDERILRPLVDVCLAWERALLAKESPKGFGPALQVLERALSYNPTDPRILAQIAEFGSVSPDHREQVDRLLKDALAGGNAPATVHFILGTSALETGDLKKALMHLEIANARNPKMPAMLNNLAWALSVSEKPDLERALRLANSALGLAPERPEILETRAQILVRLERPREAVADLEGALATHSDPSRLHATLAELYETLNQPDLAESHRRRIQPGSTPREPRK